MTPPHWPGPILPTSEEARRALKDLWSTATLVEGVVTSPSLLAESLHSLVWAPGRPEVRLVAARMPDGWTDERWDSLTLCETARPEFLLFYSAGAEFPESALLFGGSVDDVASWTTFHRRPLILHRLRERFRALRAKGRPVLRAATAIREEPVRDRGRTPPGGTDDSAVVLEIAPGEVYRRVLHAHFSDVAELQDEPSGTGPTLATHQQRAYERACAILDRYGGVIVADAVGLGKTYVGLRLIERTLVEGGRVLLIVPAALRDQWERELGYLQASDGATDRHTLAAPSDSTGDTLDLWLRETCGGRIALLSMESLGRREFRSRDYRGADLVLVDEAHNFRNSVTQRYRRLCDLLRHSRVVLLTATPINNSLFDLQHLIDLFAAPGAFRHLGVSDYRDTFRRATAGATDVDVIISACVIRRTRRFLRQCYGEAKLRGRRRDADLVLRFPERRPPVAIEYDLAGTYGDLVASLSDWLDELRFPTIDVEDEEDDGGGGELRYSGDLLKIILLKRLESSLEAFRSTIVQQLAWCSTAVDAIDAGRLLSRPDYRASFQGPGDDPGSQLAFFELMLPAPSIDAQRLSQLRRTLARDLEILAQVHAALIAIGPAGDRKLEELVKLLTGPLAGRKVLIFTEFRDTARYIHHRFRDRPHVAQIDSSGARLGLDRASRRDVIERFAPISNGLREPPLRERVDLLIATDVLSEGLNLQDASVVVSYDLPWNPVRLMQRMGRIDRLGAIADTVSLYHFVPVRDVERLLGLMGRLQSKVTTIADALGLDQPLLAPGSGDRALEQVRRLMDSPEGYERVEEELEGPMDPEEQAYVDFVALPTPSPPTRRDPAVSCVEAPAAEPTRAVSYWRLSYPGASRALWLIHDLETDAIVEDQGTALQLLRRYREYEPRPAPTSLFRRVRAACARHAGALLARLEVARIAGDSLHPGLPQCRIATRLARWVEAELHRLPPDERRRIDSLLERLARRFPLPTERKLMQLAGGLTPEFSENRLAEIEEALGPREEGSPIRRSLEEIGMLLIVPSGTAD